MTLRNLLQGVSVLDEGKGPLELSSREWTRRIELESYCRCHLKEPGQIHSAVLVSLRLGQLTLRLSSPLKLQTVVAVVCSENNLPAVPIRGVVLSCEAERHYFVVQVQIRETLKVLQSSWFYAMLKGVGIQRPWVYHHIPERGYERPVPARFQWGDFRSRALLVSLGLSGAVLLNKGDLELKERAEFEVEMSYWRILPALKIEASAEVMLGEDLWGISFRRLSKEEMELLARYVIYFINQTS